MFLSESKSSMSSSAVLVLSVQEACNVNKYQALHTEDLLTWYIAFDSPLCSLVLLFKAACDPLD